MKKYVLFGAAALMVLSGNAQLKRAHISNNLPKMPKAERLHMNFNKQANAALPAGVANKAPKKSSYMEPFYVRPAGAFYSPMIAVDGVGGYSYGNDFVLFKPFADYTWRGIVDGEDENTFYTWDFFHGPQDQLETVDGKVVVMNYGMSTQSMPKFYAVDGDPNVSMDWFDYQMTDYTMDNTVDPPKMTGSQPVQMWVIPEPSAITDEEGVDFLLSSKTLCGGGRNADQGYTFTAYYGADPWGDNQNGWWFGKNGALIDGMGQVFEKPENPYVLNKVYMMIGDNTICNGNVELTCKVYKLDEVPAYNDSLAVGLPVEPGELIVTGKGLVTPTTVADKNGFIEFTLYGFDEDDPELTYEYAPTIDYPIMVTVEGYNDPEADDLVEFTGYIAADDQSDEGYGEIAYLKYPRYIVKLDENGDTIFDEEGNPEVEYTGEHYWRGLNNFFRSGQMKTAFGIFIVADQNFITWDYPSIENGECLFPDEGGSIAKEVESDGDTLIMDGIYFYTSVPSADGDWVVTADGSDELPDWIEVELEDFEQDPQYYGWEVFANVTAEPLPEGVAYREANLRFEIPGAYRYYKVMQGDKSSIVVPEDVDGDGEITINDVNQVIEAILRNLTDAKYDVNQDGEVSIADVNRIINKIIGL